MKKICRLLLIASIVFVNFSCDSSGVFDIAQGLESVSGVVYNEQGEPLENIRIEIYYDQEQTKHYPNDEWYNYDEEYQKEYADKEPVAYTDTLGRYSFSQVARGGVDSLDLYVIARDTTKRYQSAMQIVQIKYASCSITNKGNTMTSYSGHATADFHLPIAWCGM